MNASGAWRWPLLLCGALAGTEATARSTDTQKQFDRQLQDCQRDPRYRVGGAATGECLEEATAALDAGIETRLLSLGEDRCDNVVQALADAQQQWQRYRQQQCGLYQAMFDNTAMYLNGTACRLRLTLQRQHELQQLAEFQPSLRPPCT